MVPLKLLEQRGITPEKLKEIFSVDRKLAPLSDSDLERKRFNLCNRVSARVRASKLDNIRNHKVYHALDYLWNEAYRQVTPTLLQTVMDQSPDDKSVMNALKSWGFDLSDVITEVDDPKSATKKVKRINVPAFIKITVPLARAYVTARWAKIVNDCRQQPFFKYEPAISNLRTRTQAEALTARVEIMSRQFGYFNVFKQATLQDLFYGSVVLFPYEEWYSEEQETEDEDRALKDDDGKIDKDENGRMKEVVAEGIRYHVPHPARTYWDKSFRASTLNTDTGCSYAGYWKIVKWGEVRKNKNWWNTDKVSLGAVDWTTDLAATFLNTIYGGCTMQFPMPISTEGKDRETAIADFTYSSSNEMDDKALCLSEHFEKLVPSECGIGDYDYPVWFRFVVANDNTFLYVAPLAYSPAKWSGYDYDENREDNSSLALECLPFQDAFTNLLTQHIQTVKQNLVNLTFVDEDVVPQGWIDRMQNYGEKIWRSINLLPFSSKKLRAAQNDHRQAFYSHRFPYTDTNGLIAAMRMLLEIMERILQMSSQELAQAASHELRQDEVRNIASSTANRLVFTATPIHQLKEAVKIQIYEALMAHGQDEFWTQVPVEPELTKEKLKELGFTWDDGRDKLQSGDTKISVRANKKKALAYFMIASNRDGDDRINNSQLAVTMATALGQWMSNPILAQAIGADQAIDILNMVCQFAGFPREVKFKNKLDPKAAAAQQQAQAQEIVKMAEQLKADILNQVQQSLKQVIDEGVKMKQDTDAQVQAVDAQVQQLMAKFTELDKIVAQAIEMAKAHDQSAQGPVAGEGGPPVAAVVGYGGIPTIPPPVVMPGGGIPG